MLASFRVARYRFVLEAIDELRMPAYQGSTFRGGLGHVLKRLVCFAPDARACVPCGRRIDCPYGYLFATTAPPDIPGLHGLREIPPPFVIEAPSGEPRRYHPGEQLGFDLVLIGRAIGYLPYFLMAFQELGRAGVGRPSGRYALRSIHACRPWGTEQQIFDGAEVRPAAEPSVSWPEVADRAALLPADRLTLRFLTPTRIKYQRGYVERPEFHMLLRALLRRISALALFHCGERWPGDARALIAAADPVRIAGAQLRWVGWERFSGRQQQRIQLGGFAGEITYHGDLAPFREYLALGALVHVGKAAVFGHGRYDIVTPSG